MPHSSNNKSDRSELGKLYPTPKTYDQLAKDRQAADKLRAKRMPRHIILSTSLKTYSVLVALAIAVFTATHILKFNIISGVFFSFLLGLAWFGYIAWIIASITNIFQTRELTATPFFVVYACTFPILAFGSYKLMGEPFLAFVLITCVHFILVYILLKIMSKNLVNRL